MFQLLDLAIPIGTTVLAVVLCILGIIKAKTRPAVVVCVITATVFVGGLVGWYVMRWKSWQHDYKTDGGLLVRQGEKNHCDKVWVEEHVDWLKQFWSQHCEASRVATSLDRKFLVCLDEEKINALGRHARGYVFGNVAVIGWNGSKKYAESLLKHELSHLIAKGACLIPFNEDEHHEFFAKNGLGH